MGRIRLVGCYVGFIFRVNFIGLVVVVKFWTFVL